MVKLLVFTDSHNDPLIHKELKKKSKHAEIILCCGDFSIFESKIQKTLKFFESFKKPFLLIPGNHESNKTIKELCSLSKYLKSIHNKFYCIKNLTFFGYGGDGFSLTNKKLEKSIPKIEKKAKKISERKTLIIATHGPPYNTLLDYISTSTGSMSVRKLIQKTKPKYAFSGHLHENFGVMDVLGRKKEILLCNPGPLGMIFDI